jgi:hypothetical protein
MSRDRLQQAVTDAFLALEASKKVMESCIKAYEAMLLHGTAPEIERYRAAIMSSCEAHIDRIEQLIWAQLEAGGIDPQTRKLR